MAEPISKRAFINRLILRLLLTPFLFLLLLLLLSAFLAPFLENQFSAVDFRLVAAALSVAFLFLFLWLPYIKETKIDSRADRFRIEQIAKIISEFDLNLEEAELINKVEGWDYQNVVGDKLSKDQVGEAFDLSKSRMKKESYPQRYWVLGMMILSFLMAPFGFAGLLHWRSSGIPPFFSGLLCLSCGCFLLYGYIKRR